MGKVHFILQMMPNWQLECPTYFRRFMAFIPRCSKINMVSFPNAIVKDKTLCQQSHSYAKGGDIVLQETLAGFHMHAAGYPLSKPIHQLRRHNSRDIRKELKHAHRQSLHLLATFQSERCRALHAMTLPPSLPTLSTRPQSLPSILTVDQASGPAAFNFVLGWSSNPSSPSSTCLGSSSGFVRPVQTLDMFRESVAILSFKLPCILAANSSFGTALLELPLLAVLVVVAIASFVKRSEIALSWMRDGRMMCASGSLTRGSWIPSTLTAVKTRIGMSCVTTVSLSLAFASRLSSRNALSPNGSALAPFKNPFALFPLLIVFVMIVRERTGIPSFFVSRMEADVAWMADFRARWRGGSGSSRLMVLFGAAD
jgi:hypothetical protein